MGLARQPRTVLGRPASICLGVPWQFFRIDNKRLHIKCVFFFSTRSAQCCPGRRAWVSFKYLTSFISLWKRAKFFFFLANLPQKKKKKCLWWNQSVVYISYTSHRRHRFWRGISHFITEVWRLHPLSPFTFPSIPLQFPHLQDKQRAQLSLPVFFQSLLFNTLHVLGLLY